MVKQRNSYIDFIKGIVITFVVLGHCIQSIEYNGSNAFYADNLFKYIYIFHMPILIAISGYYSYNSINKRTLFNFIKTRFYQLLIPMAIWCIIYSIIISTFTDHFNITKFIEILNTSILYQY